MRRSAVGALFALLVSLAVATGRTTASASVPVGRAPGAAASSTSLSPAAALSGSSKFVPLTPTRVLDTRIGLGEAGPVPPGGTVTLVMPGRGGLPSSGVTAVLLNVTLTEATGPGFVQLFPTGQAAVGSSSNLNVEYAGETIPNLVVAPLGDVGQVSLYTQGGGHLIADVFGYFIDASTSVDGRYVPVFPNRLLDTRMQPPGKLGSGGSVRVQIVGRGGVPATGASAVVLNVTATEATESGFVQVLPTGQVAFGAFSNLNVTAGQTVPNLVVVPVGPDGSVTVFSQRGTHVVADVFGYFTNQTAQLASDGLFVPISPSRLLDTRNGSKPGPGSITSIAPRGQAGVPSSGVAAVFGNLTVTEASGPGYVQVVPGPAGAAPVGFWSNANIERAGQTIPNAAIANLGNDTTMLLYTLSSTHLVFDVSGYFTGAVAIVNHAPTVLPISVSVTGGQSIDINVLGYASEPDGDPMTVTGFSQPTDGNVSQLSSDTIRYSSYVGADRSVSFTVTVSDNRGASTTAVVTAHVTSGVVPTPCSTDFGGSGAYPAENAQLSGYGGAGKRCVNTGFRGSGYIGDWNGNQAVTFTVYAPASGQYNLDFRYQNARETSTRELTGPSGTTTMVFLNTHGGDTNADWSIGAWTQTSTNVWLNAGANSVTLSGGGGFVDIDEITSVTAGSPAAPNAPSELRGTALNWSGNVPTSIDSGSLPIGTFRLEWRDNSNNETGFRVFRLYGGARTVLAEFPANTTVGIVQQAGFDRYGGGDDLLSVVAFNGAGESAPTGYYDVFAPVPAAPQLLSHTRVNNALCGPTATDCRQVRFTHTSTLGWTTYNFVANFVLFSSGVSINSPAGSCFGTTCDYTVTFDAGQGGLGQNPNCINITGLNSGRRNFGPNSNTICIATSGARTYEAEYASLTGSPPPIVSTENPGYSGTGYVGVFGYTGQRITFNVTNDTNAQYVLTLRERSIETGVSRAIYVNGAYVGNMSLPKAANAWTENAWVTASYAFAISLRAGDNTIAIEYSGSGASAYADIDSITIS